MSYLLPLILMSIAFAGMTIAYVMQRKATAKMHAAYRLQCIVAESARQHSEIMREHREDTARAIDRMEGL